MESNSEFELGQFLTDSLNLQSNCCLPTRQMYPKPVKNRYQKFIDQNPYDILYPKIPWDEDEPGALESPIQKFYDGLHVMVTGGTGFVGKLLTEKLLRGLPHIGHIYLLVRPKKGMSPADRFEKLMEDKVMRKKVPGYRSKVTVIEGDLLLPGLGLRPEDIQLLEDRVEVVFHSAADVKFTEPLRVAVESNVVGSKRILDLAKSMSRLKAYVHVSTAYSQCVRRVIEEKVPKISINYKELLNYLESHTDGQIEEDTARLIQGWPNTYVFSKAVCEDMLQEEAVGLPVSIFRPSVVYPTYREPVRGYTDNLYGPIAFFVGAGHGVVHCQRMMLDLSLDVVPVDYTVNCLIAVAVQTASRSREEISVYNFTSTSQKSSCWKTIVETSLSVVDLWPFDRAIWRTSFFTTESYLVYTLFFYLLHILPGLCFDKVFEWTGEKMRLMRIYKRLQSVNKYMWYFLSNKWLFINDNVVDLWNTLDPRDRIRFNFDLRDVEETEFFLISKLGMKYFYLKENVDDMRKTQKKETVLYWLHLTLKTVCGLVVLKLLVCIARVLPV